MNVNPEDEIPSLPIRIDKEGVWFYNGAVMFRKDILKLFFESLKVDELGRYLIEFEGDKCLIEVEDTPFVVKTAGKSDVDEHEPQSIEVLLSDLTLEKLDISTLKVAWIMSSTAGSRIEKFKARFSRPGYYQIAEFIKYDEDKDAYLCPLMGEITT